jgi:hypothetical protein
LLILRLCAFALNRKKNKKNASKYVFFNSLEGLNSWFIGL